MNQDELVDLTDEALLQERKKVKLTNTANAVLIGIFIGIAIYSAVNNGLGFATVFPLFFVYIAFKNEKKAQALKKELQSRNLD